VSKSPYGNLLFLGRTDFQLKINGYRIEPGEVEYALGRLNGNNLCAVVALNGPEGLSSLCAFTEGQGEERVLLAGLKDLLPPQFIPRRIVFLKKMPLNPNGKIDRTELLKFV
jgi:acyl-coenzyme A synthetase/AMP-(fatty) acid ligase